MVTEFVDIDHYGAENCEYDRELDPNSLRAH